MSSEDIVERVKEANPIEDVIQADGFPLRRSGRYWKGTREDCDSLVVDEIKQMFVWNSRSGDGWAGDVIRWVEKQRGLEFRSAVEWLAERARLPLKWGHVDEGALRLTRVREDAFEVATRVFGRWLWEDAGALGYARGRGWSDETIREAGLGFSGRRLEPEFKEMKGEFSLHQIEQDSPAAVCVLGFRGDVKRWATKWGVDVEGERWVEWGMIPGAMGKTRLVYPHWMGGRVRYFSTRTILDDREYSDLVGEDGKPFRKEIKGKWNPYEKLAGQKQLFFNHQFRRDAEAVVIVEGPADAISLGQLGLASVALCGLAATEGAGSGLRKLLEGGPKGSKKSTVYVALDQDEAGQRGVEKVARVFGPMTRVVRF